jgi:hypothetical protein
MGLTLDDIRKPRSCSDFLAFVALISRRASSTPEARALFRLESGAYKRWRDEVLPLASFCEAENLTGAAVVEIFADDGPVDAQISGWPSPTDAVKVEITRAIDGQDERLRMELLTHSGSAPGAGPIRRVRTNGTNSIDAELEAESHADIVARVAKLACDAIEKKSAKAYPPGTLLLVDAVEHRATSCESRPRLEKDCKLAAAQTCFGRVYLLVAYRNNEGGISVGSSRIK